MDIRIMTIEDYEKVYGLWRTIRGFGIRSMDDSREGVRRFLHRNRAVPEAESHDQHHRLGRRSADRGDSLRA